MYPNIKIKSFHFDHSVHFMLYNCIIRTRENPLERARNFNEKHRLNEILITCTPRVPPSTHTRYLFIWSSTRALREAASSERAHTDTHSNIHACALRHELAATTKLTNNSPHVIHSVITKYRFYRGCAPRAPSTAQH